MRARADVLAKVDAPFECAVEFVAVKICWACKAVVGVVVRVGGVPFEYDFVLSVAIDVADRGVVGIIEIFFAEGVDAEFGALERDVYIARGRVGRQGVACDGFVALESANFVFCLAVTRVVVGKECGIGDGLGVDFLAVTIYVECLVLGVGLEVTPRYSYTRRIFAHSHNATSELFAL